MIELPSLPKSFTTRQITCVSCGESFALTEAYKRANHPVNSNPVNYLANENEDEPGWRILPDNTAATDLRFLKNRTQRPVTPPTRSEPTVPDIDAESDSQNFINCPRCGADNRNWAQILNRPRPSRDLKNLPAVVILVVVVLGAATLALLLLLSFPFFQADVSGVMETAAACVLVLFTAACLWYASDRLFNGINLTENLLASLGALAAALVAFLAALKLDEVSLHTRAIPLAAAVFLAGFLPPLFMTRQWISVFQWQQQQRYLPVYIPKPRQSPLLLTGAVVIVFLAILTPLFAYIVLPIGLHTFVNSITPDVPVKPRQIVVNLNQDVEAWLDQEVEAPLPQPAQAAYHRQAVQDLNKLLMDYLAHAKVDQPQIQYARDMIEQLPPLLVRLPQDVTADVYAALSSFEEYAWQHPTDDLSELSFKVPEDIPRKFLVMWVIAVGLSGLWGAGLAMTAVTQYTRQIMEQVPSPIYYSVANMTRVVAWEAGLSLENTDYIPHVQWVDVQRNNLGGVNLVGLYRDLPEFDAYGRPLCETVRALRYAISTDMWGRIEFAEVRDVCMPRFGTPHYASVMPTPSLPKWVDVQARR